MKINLPHVVSCVTILPVTINYCYNLTASAVFGFIATTRV